MNLTQTLKHALGRTAQRLTRLDDQPLGRATLLIVVFLDLFILTAIFDGLAAHTRQLTAPEEYIPHTCRTLVIDRDWHPADRLDRLSALISTAASSPQRPAEARPSHHPLCAPYLDLIDRIQADAPLASLLDTYRSQEREARALQQQIDRLKGSYDTALLERMAGGTPGATPTDASRADFQAKAAALDALKARSATLTGSIEAHDAVRALWAALQSPPEPARQQLLDDLRQLNFWFPVKRLGMQLIFLLPLFVAFYAWNGASIRRGHGLQTLVSAHLLAVSAIPILAKLIETLYHIVPRKLLASLFAFLEAFKLVALWHYLTMAAAVAGALLLIHLFQKKLFSRERLLERRIQRGECQRCGRHLPAESAACPFCGYAQLRPCAHCQQAMHRHAPFCRHCGQPAEG